MISVLSNNKVQGRHCLSVNVMCACAIKEYSAPAVRVKLQSKTKLDCDQMFHPLNSFSHPLRLDDVALCYHQLLKLS